MPPDLARTGRRKNRGANKSYSRTGARKTRTGQGHVEVSRNCELDRELLFAESVTSTSLGAVTDTELKL
jgi:hypothetical protein